jgi:ABC-type Fe3+/spermidine/putrescine transport system ATPase subunit
MASLRLRNLAKQFASVAAVNDVSLDIPSGEFFSILGPSGCGKTTLLRMIAGFENPNAGTIHLAEKDITRTPPQERGIAMVFQNYALFPHMTVYENVAFGLEARRVPKSEIRSRVEQTLETVHLREKIRVPVPRLSGGEQQRVAVARALVVRPSLLLFDEPLSNLDVALRLATREEIRSLQRITKITTVYVTHDQSEAMSLSDRIAVMRGGRIEQVGTPAEMYDSPSSVFVATFLGGANIVAGESCSGRVRAGPFEEVSPPDPVVLSDGPVYVAVKPEAISLSDGDPTGSVRGIVREKEYLGFTTNFVVEISGTLLRVLSLSSAMTHELHPGDEVGVQIDWSRCTFLRESP